MQAKKHRGQHSTGPVREAQVVEELKISCASEGADQSVCMYVGRLVKGGDTNIISISYFWV